jgi:hypothetical protein
MLIQLVIKLNSTKSSCDLFLSGPLSTELPIFLNEHGISVMKTIDTVNKEESWSFSDSYTAIRKYFFENKITCLEKNDMGISSFTGLYRCKLQSGNIVWMCPKHIEVTGAQIIDDRESQALLGAFEEKNTMLENIIEIEERQRNALKKKLVNINKGFSRILEDIN